MKGVATSVQCPKCHLNFSIFTEHPDWNARLRAADTVLKASDLLKDNKTLRVEGEVLVLTIVERLSLAQIQKARREGLTDTVSLQMKRRLIEKGAIPALEEGKEDVFEGEAKEVTE